MTLIADITISAGVGIAAVAILAVGDPVYIALIALISAVVTPVVSAIVMIVVSRAGLAKVVTKVEDVAVRVEKVDDKATKIGEATDGMNSALTKEVASRKQEAEARERENQRLSALVATLMKQAETLALVTAKGAPTVSAPSPALAPSAVTVDAPSAPTPVEVVNPPPVPVEIKEGAVKDAVRDAVKEAAEGK